MWRRRNAYRKFRRSIMRGFYYFTLNLKPKMLPIRTPRCTYPFPVGALSLPSASSLSNVLLDTMSLDSVSCTAARSQTRSRQSRPLLPLERCVSPRMDKGALQELFRISSSRQQGSSPAPKEGRRAGAYSCEKKRACRDTSRHIIMSPVPGAPQLTARVAVSGTRLGQQRTPTIKRRPPRSAWGFSSPQPSSNFGRLPFFKRSVRSPGPCHPLVRLRERVPPSVFGAYVSRLAAQRREGEALLAAAARIGGRSPRRPVILSIRSKNVKLHVRRPEIEAKQDFATAVLSGQERKRKGKSDDPQLSRRRQQRTGEGEE